jgi:hypothetical protein
MQFQDFSISADGKLFTLTIKKELKNGNTGRTKHFSAAHREKQQWLAAIPQSYVVTAQGIEMTLGQFYHEVLLEDALAQRVGLVIERVLGPRQRLWDHDSTLRGAKELVDSLVTYGILEDDNARHVSWCLGVQDSDDKQNGPYVRVHFFESQG